MATAQLTYLLDTNILLRLSEKYNSEFQFVRPALLSLINRQARLCYTSQNFIEFWNVATRPARQNGHGLSISDADIEASGIEAAFELLPEKETIHSAWRRLVVNYSVSGAQVHDARLVACMKTHGITHLLTLNTRDFVRYKEITVVHPNQVPVSQ